MITKVKSFGVVGVEGYVVSAEVDIAKGMPSYTLVGLPDTAVKEGKERVHSAIRNSGIKFPLGRIVINLAPANTQKTGAIYDLAIAVGILSSAGELKKDTDDFAFIGELGLNGELKKVNGLLPMLITAVQNKIPCVIIPKANEHEARFVSGVKILTAKTLFEVYGYFAENFNNLREVEPLSFAEIKNESHFDADLKYVKGQYIAKRALEVAAAGGHNILLIGPPGSGKTMLAKCFPTILPDLTFEESIECTKIHSIAGVLDSKFGIITTRPFRTPHHTASGPALAGGGSNSKPGEISLAHNGVLFLDEMPEYQRNCLELLRQPLEDNRIVVSRANGSIEYPASFTLVASMNPCPCGYYGSRAHKCTCNQTCIQKYMSRLSGPLLDRIDLHIEVDGVSYDDLSTTDLEEPSENVRARVNKARTKQLERFSGKDYYSNAKMSAKDVKEFCRLSPECEQVLKSAFERLKLSARAYTRILKVARTIADIDASPEIKKSHIEEAIGYRALDRLVNNH